MKFSIVTAALLSTCVFAQAADDFASAFKDGKLDGRIRLHTMATDWDKNEQWLLNGSKADGDSLGTAIGGSLIYKTAPLYGFGMGVGFYNTNNSGMLTKDDNGATAGHPKNSTASDLFARGPGSTTNFGDGYTVVAQSYIQYDITKTSLKGGRLLMSNPFISPNDSKMVPIAIEGFDAVSTDVSNTTIQLDYANRIKERGMTYFGTMADTGDTPDAIKNYYKTHYTTNATNANDNASGVAIVGLKNKSIDSLELQGWYMNWSDIIDQAMAEANYKLKAGDVALTFGTRYMKQFDNGAGEIIKPHSGDTLYGTSGGIRKKGDDDNSVDTYMAAIRTIVAYKAARFTLAYAHTGEEGDLIAPWRGFPTEGYTRSMTQTDWNANTNSYKAQLDYDFNAILSGLSALLSNSYYDRDTSKVGYQSQTDRYYGNGDTRQWNADVKYALANVKGLELKLRTMIQKNDVVKAIVGNSGATASQGIGNDTSNRELRFEINYLF
ncbi:MAG: OprD family outer membrane porin [Sulfuricurvum sp.]|jgi:hypothetical protein